MELNLGFNSAEQKFRDVQVGQIFIIGKYIYLKTESSDYEDNSFCLGDLTINKPTFFFECIENDTTVDEIITNAKIVW